MTRWTNAFIVFSGPTAVVPQYYSVQTPWGIYPAGLIQQGAAAGQQTPQAVTPQVCLPIPCEKED